MSDPTIDILRTILAEPPRIIGRQDYLNSAVLVPLLRVAGQWHLLFEKRTNHIRQGGEICFPGGMVDLHRGESPLDTALRETEEELGLATRAIHLLGHLGTLIAPTGTIVDAMVGWLDISDLDLLRLNPEEVERVFTVPLDYFHQHPPERHSVRTRTYPYRTEPDGQKVITFPAAELNVPSRYQHPWPGAVIRVLVYQVAGETIWGITARIIHHLVERLSGE